MTDRNNDSDQSHSGRGSRTRNLYGDYRQPEDVPSGDSELYETGNEQPSRPRGQRYETRASQESASPTDRRKPDHASKVRFRKARRRRARARKARDRQERDAQAYNAQTFGVQTSDDSARGTRQRGGQSRGSQPVETAPISRRSFLLAIPVLAVGACVAARASGLFTGTTTSGDDTQGVDTRQLADAGDLAAQSSSADQDVEIVTPAEPAVPVPTWLPEWVDDESAQRLLSERGTPLVDDILIDAEQLGAINQRMAAKILKLAANDPTARSFVSEFLESYPGYKAAKLTEADLNPTGIPLFMQWDQRWGYMPYLGGCLGTNGCCPTCLSMIYTGFTGKTDLSPYDVAAMAVQSGLCDQESGTWGEFVVYFAERYGFECVDLDDVWDASNYLNQGYLLVCNLGPGAFTDVGHYVIVTGYASEGNVLVRDSYTTSVNQRTWPLDDVIMECNSAYAIRTRA